MHILVVTYKYYSQMRYSVSTHTAMLAPAHVSCEKHMASILVEMKHGPSLTAPHPKGTELGLTS